jgi:WD40 repeat protein
VSDLIKLYIQWRIEFSIFINLLVLLLLQAVTCVCLLFDGRIASGSEDFTVRVWDGYSGRCTRIFSGHTDVIFVASILFIKLFTILL